MQNRSSVLELMAGNCEPLMTGHILAAGIRFYRREARQPAASLNKLVEGMLSVMYIIDLVELTLLRVVLGR
jgi:hypothetical protein